MPEISWKCLSFNVKITIKVWLEGMSYFLRYPILENVLQMPSIPLKADLQTSGKIVDDPLAFKKKQNPSVQS